MSLSRNSSSLSLWSVHNSSSSSDEDSSSPSSCFSDIERQNNGSCHESRKRRLEGGEMGGGECSRTNVVTCFQDIQLKIIRQPEEQHRARYMSEGSRGAIKDRSGTSHCTLQLVGYGRPTALEVYVGLESDPLVPHPLYRVIPVTGKGSTNLTTPCTHNSTPDGFHSIELMLRPEHNMTALLDCIGILKVCSHDVRRKMKSAKSSKGARIRLVFRATISDPLSPSRNMLLQTFSDPISCVQQLGFPEIQKMSLTSDGVKGGSELIILGRNFDRNSAVIFREYNSEGRLVWNSEAELDKKLQNTCHLVCSVPTYRDLNMNHDVEITLVISCGSKISHSHQFTYKPDFKGEEVSQCLDPQRFQRDWASGEYVLPSTSIPSSNSCFGGAYNQEQAGQPNSACPDSPPGITNSQFSSVAQTLEMEASSSMAGHDPQAGCQPFQQTEPFQAMGMYPSEYCTDYSLYPPTKRPSTEGREEFTEAFYSTY